jgi:hypothetical protein
MQGDAVPLTPAKGRYTPFGIPAQIHQNPLKGILLNLVSNQKMTAAAWGKEICPLEKKKNTLRSFSGVFCFYGEIIPL